MMLCEAWQPLTSQFPDSPASYAFGASDADSEDEADLLTAPCVRARGSEAASLQKLFVLIKQRDLRSVETWVESRTSLDICLRHNYSPLTAAICLNAPLDIVSRIIRAGANINIRDGRGKSPLTTACEVMNRGAVRMLIAHGVNLNTRDGSRNGNTHSWTPLMTASYVGSTELVELLLDAGAKVDARDDEGRTAFIVAAQAQEVAVMSLLQKAHCNINAQTRSGETALSCASLNNCDDVAFALLEMGVDTRLSYYDDGHTALMVAMSAGHREVIEVLLESASECLNLQDHLGMTALIHATKMKNHKLISDLLRAGADCAIADRLGKTALHYAAENGLLLSLPTLLENGADLNCRDNFGFTPLMVALETGEQLFAYHLLAHTRNPWAPEPWPRATGVTSALQIAAIKGHSSLFIELLRRSLPVDVSILNKARVLLVEH